MSKKHYRVNEVASLLKVSPTSVRRYANEGRLEHNLTPMGQRVFTQEQLDAFLGVEETQKVTVFYVRSSQGKQEQLDSQADLLTKAYGLPVRIYSDKGSGLNENRKGLKRLLDDASNHKFTQLVITQQDRLTRFGYSYLERLLDAHGVSILILGETKEKSLYDELLQDFMSLIASFSGKFYRLRGYEQQHALIDLAKGTLVEKQETP